MSTLADVRKSKKTEFDDLIGPTDPKVEEQARERLIIARVDLLLNSPFFGNIATRLKLVNADEWCPTAATDGLTLYYNSRFIMKLRPKEVTFLVGHEVLHVVYGHMDRRGNRDPMLHNIAADYAVNADLKKHKVGEFVTSVPCLYDPKYEGWSSEEIYEDLEKNAQKINLQSLIDKLLDQHLDNDGEGDGEDDGEDDGNPKKGPAKLSKEEKEQMKRDIRDAILNAASMSAGDLPAGVSRLVKAITEPVMDWRELIQTTLTSAFKSDYSWTRPSRRAWHMDAVMPGMTPGEEIDVDIYFDLSGSISEQQAKEFLSEVIGMMDMFDGYRIRVACFDTQVYNVEEYTSENLDNADDYEMAGGGGTDFTCIFEDLKEAGRTPNKLIVFTDGYPCGSWGDPDYCDTLWIIHGDRNPNPPFGVFAIYDDHRNK